MTDWVLPDPVAFNRGSRSTVVEHWAADQHIEQRFYTWSIFYTQIHLISPDCPRPSIALPCKCA